MRNTPAFLLLALLAACNSASTTSPAADSTLAKPAGDSAAMRPINSPYPVRYSSKFVMDEPKNAETVLALWKAYDAGDLSTTRNLIADTMEVRLANGMNMRMSGDSVVAAIQRVRSSFKRAEDRVDAVMAVKSTDHNERWALIWGMEIDTHMDGKVDSVDLQETWRFNEAGKADLLIQYSRPVEAPKKKK
jgi:hypothetical protein